MKKNIISLTISSLCLSSFFTIAYADNYYDNGQENNWGRSQIEFRQGNIHFEIGRHDRNRHHEGYREMHWVDIMDGEPVPEGTVTGGGEPGINSVLYVCRAYYHGGQHPGKVVSGRCNITWGGEEIPMTRYQVLVSFAPLNWLPASYGRLPPNAIPGGYEQGRPLYICQAEYHGSMHPGKVVGHMCNIGWGGKEIPIPYYNVLVR